MTFKRIVAWTMLFLLLLSSSACRINGAGDTFEHTTYFSLSEEEFYGEPDLIIRATVDLAKKQYTLEPSIHTEWETVDVTIYHLTILETLRGNLNDEQPGIFPIKVYNNGGNSEGDPFYLTVGEEYVLGLSDVREQDDPYEDGGGYILIGPRRWTFHLGPNGEEYRNSATKANSFNLPNLDALKDKITPKYEPSPPTEVVPLYTVDERIKDPTITAEQREQFFDFVQKWRVDAMTEFSPGKPMQLELFKYYCAYFVTDEEKSLTDMGVNYTGAAIERIAKWFGTTYNLKDDEPVFLKAGSLRDLPLAELIQYKEEKVDGKTLVTARCIQYSFPEYYYVDWSDVPKMESYAGHKRMILDGYVSSGYENYSVFDFSFYTEDGKTPTQFVAYNCYYPESFDKGFPLPDFIPSENAETNQKEPTETTPEPEVDPLPKVTVVRDETPELEKLASGVFYYGIKEFYPALKNEENVELRELLKTNLLAPYDIYTRGKEEAEKGLCQCFETQVLGSSHLDMEICRYPEYTVTKITGNLGSFWLISTPSVNADFLYNKMVLMNAPADAVIIRSTGWLYQKADRVYYFQIQRFFPSIDGKQVDFEEFLNNEPNAVDKLLKQADQDAKKKLCEKNAAYDGGTVRYDYKNYSIIKFHASVPDLEDPNTPKYNEAIVIGPKDMTYGDAYDAIFKGSRPI